MIIPTLNSICGYTFTTGFTTLNGIYTLVEVMTYTEAQTEGINFVTYLYTPAGLPSTQYATDSPNYVTNRVLKLIPANQVAGQTPMLYVPESLIATIPDPMVSCYNNLAIGVSLGYFEDQTTLAWVISEINQVISSTVGTSNSAVLYSLGTQYMEISAYNSLVAQRQAALAQQTAQHGPYLTLYQQLQSAKLQVQQLQTLVQYYENTLISLNA